MNSSSNRLLVLGHRGFRARYPENTLRAFREALTAGADGIECDIQKTADGHFVVIHDPDTQRVAGKRLEIGSATLAELRELDFGSGERIPTLEEMLEDLPPDAYLDLELKEETITLEDCPAIARALDAARDRYALMISSFGAPLLGPFRKMGFTVGLLVGEETASRGLGSFLGTLIKLRPQYLNLPVEAFQRLGEATTHQLLRFMRVFGFSYLFWTVNTVAAARPVLGHARIIVTDEVEVLVRMRGQKDMLTHRGPGQFPYPHAQDRNVSPP